MGKKKDTKTPKVKKKRRNPLTLIESKFPDIPISLYIIVPLAVGTVVGVNLTNNIPLGVLCGLILTGVVWFGKEYIPEPPPPVVLSYTPDDLVMSIFDQTWFVSAVPADDNARPEAYSVDGQRWSHKLELTTEYDDKDVFIVRGSLVTGEAWLEYVPEESAHRPEFWQNDEVDTVGENIPVEEGDSVDHLSNNAEEIDYTQENEHVDEESENNTGNDNDTFGSLDDNDFYEPHSSVAEEPTLDTTEKAPMGNSIFLNDNTDSLNQEQFENTELNDWDTKEDSETEFTPVLWNEESDAEENSNTAPKNS